MKKRSIIQSLLYVKHVKPSITSIQKTLKPNEDEKLVFKNLIFKLAACIN